MKNIVILISGGGSNMRALLEYAQQKNWEALGLARIVAVISNHPDAVGLNYAREQGVETAVVPHQNYANRAAFEAVLSAKIDGYEPNAVLLAGFMRILTADFTDHYSRRMFNIHPSILPNFKGLHTHEAVIRSGVKVHGATVHGVTAELDHGPIVLQSCVPVWANDTVDLLAARVLKTEHLIYPQMLDWWVNDRLVWTDEGITILPNIDGRPVSQILMMSEEKVND